MHARTIQHCQTLRIEKNPAEPKNEPKHRPVFKHLTLAQAKKGRTKLRDDDASGVTECYGATPTTTQPAPQEQIINEALVNALAKANGGTCSNNCHCAIA